MIPTSSNSNVGNTSSPECNGNNSFAIPETVDLSCSPVPVPIPYPNVGPKAEGVSLPPTVRVELETKFAADLGCVKIFENHAPTLLGAKAFTSGTDIFLAPGTFNVTAEGKKVLAHECAHVLQQSLQAVNEAVQDIVAESNANDGSDAND